MNPPAPAPPAPSVPAPPAPSVPAPTAPSVPAPPASLPWIGNLSSHTATCSPRDELVTLKKTVAHPSFRHFAKAAYDAKDGYSIRVNPQTNKREMFIAGTRDLKQWVLNAFDSLLHVHGFGDIEILDPWRFKKQNELGKIAVNNNVEVVYGHSRGGAIAADMPLSECTQRVGLDAAMIMANNKDMINLNEGGGINPMGLFDAYIGQTGRNNVTVDYSTFTPHKVWSIK